MINRKFEAWCEQATEKIRYGPDRRAVSAELQAHLEDKYEALIAKGIPSEDAAAQTLESMGSAREIAPQLGAIHRPWLGYLYSFVKFLGITTGVLAACALSLILYTSLGDLLPRSQGPYLPRVYEKISCYCEPELSDYVDGYYFCIDEAAVGEYEEEIKFLFHMEIRWWPWMQDPAFMKWLWAVDSLGNYYSPYSAYAYGQPRIRFHGSSGGGWGTEVTMSLEQFDTDAQWVEICCDRDGRDIRFRIDLTGGDARE